MMGKIAGYIGFFILSRINLRGILPGVADLVEAGRVQALRLAGADIGPNCFVRAGAKINIPHYLKMGENSKINLGARLHLFDDLQIGRNVEIGPEFLVYNSEHKIDDPSQPLTKQGCFTAPVVIGDDVYIGARVTMLKGAVIENRVVVAAGAVVTGRLESGYIYGGVPARKIKAL